MTGIASCVPKAPFEIVKRSYVTSPACRAWCRNEKIIGGVSDCDTTTVPFSLPTGPFGSDGLAAVHAPPRRIFLRGVIVACARSFNF